MCFMYIPVVIPLYHIFIFYNIYVLLCYVPYVSFENLPLVFSLSLSQVLGGFRDSSPDGRAVTAGGETLK